MAYIFLDESGDLGFDFFKKRTSKFFVVTILFADQKRPIEKLIRKVHAGLRKKHKIRTSTLRAAKEEPANIARICRGLTEKNCKVMTIYLDKSKVFTNLRDEKHVLYNYIVNILLDRIMNRNLVSKKEGVILVASKRETNKFLNENFRDYICQQIKTKHGAEITVEIKTPAEEKCLQAADIASWSIFRKYEYGDDSFYQLLKAAIVEENILYK
jgi:Protein of unknown function (DUF3800)